MPLSTFQPKSSFYNARTPSFRRYSSSSFSIPPRRVFIIFSHKYNNSRNKNTLHVYLSLETRTFYIYYCLGPLLLPILHSNLLIQLWTQCTRVISMYVFSCLFKMNNVGGFIYLDRKRVRKKREKREENEKSQHVHSCIYSCRHSVFVCAPSSLNLFEAIMFLPIFFTHPIFPLITGQEEKSLFSYFFKGSPMIHQHNFFRV